MSQGHGYEVRVKGRIGPALLRNFEPWQVQGIDGRTSILMPYAEEAALHGLLARLDDFALELVDVIPLSMEEARALSRRAPSRRSRGSAAGGEGSEQGE